MKFFTLAGFLAMALFLDSCTTYKIARPIYPSSLNPQKEARIVPSLQPLLSWETSPEIVASYDIVIYEVKVDSTKKGVKRERGGKVYYRENVAGNAHIVQAVLRPDTEYYWTFRIRNGKDVSDWASYNYRSFLFLTLKAKDSYHRFRTPYIRPITFQPFDPLDHW
jgi:hypothetical protein